MVAAATGATTVAVTAEAVAGIGAPVAAGETAAARVAAAVAGDGAVAAAVAGFSRVGREIGVFRHVTPPTTLCLEFPRETGLILRCAGNVGNPFQTKQGNRPSCLEQEGRRCSDEVVREPRCSCRVRPACPGTFGVASRVQSTVSHFKTERGSFLETP